MKVLYLVSVWLHIIAAAIWIGGSIFLALVMVPALRRPEYQGMAAPFLQFAARRFRWVGWVSLAIMAVTGLFNLIARQFPLERILSLRLWSTGFGRTLGWKLLLVLAILALSALHDTIIGQRAMAAMHDDPRSPEARRLRRQAAWIGRINLLLALAVAALGVMLVRGVP